MLSSLPKLKQLSVSYVNILANELLRAGKNSTRKLISSLKATVEISKDKTEITINALKYLIYVDKGRRKGSYPPIQAIKSWCRIKNIPEEAAFPIARKIYKFGIKPTNVIDKTNKRFIIKHKKDIKDDIINKITEDTIVKLKKI